MSEKNRKFNFVIAYGMVILAAFLFQTALAFRFDIAGVRLSVLLPLVVVTSMFLGSVKCGIFGGVLGFLCDAVAGGAGGVYTITLLLLGIGLGYVSAAYFRRNVLSVLMLYCMTYGVLLLLVPLGIFLVFDNLAKSFAILQSLFFEGLYSAILVAPLFFLIQKIDEILAVSE